MGVDDPPATTKHDRPAVDAGSAAVKVTLAASRITRMSPGRRSPRQGYQARRAAEPPPEAATLDPGDPFERPDAASHDEDPHDARPRCLKARGASLVMGRPAAPDVVEAPRSRQPSPDQAAPRHRPRRRGRRTRRRQHQPDFIRRRPPAAATDSGEGRGGEED
jgi:hypothetical protein